VPSLQIELGPARPATLKSTKYSKKSRRSGARRHISTRLPFNRRQTTHDQDTHTYTLVLLTLNRWPSYTNLTWPFEHVTAYTKYELSRSRLSTYLWKHTTPFRSSGGDWKYRSRKCDMGKIAGVENAGV